MAKTNHAILYNDTNLGSANIELWFTEIEDSWESDCVFNIIDTSTADKIIFVSSEVSDFYFDKKIQENKKVYFFLPSVLNKDRYFNYMFWMDWARQVEEHTQLSRFLLTTQDKDPEFMFDCLLGVTRARPNKLFVDEQVQQKKNFFLYNKDATFDDNGKLINWIPGGKFDKGNFRENFNNNQQANIDCFIPYDLYNNSWYSIVAETRFNYPGFYTEKTARPIVAKRLFVHFGSHNHLAGLKKLGYKTFNSVIDESYDTIENNQERWEAAWKQVEYLITQDPVEIYKTIQPILDHNKNLIMKTDCYNTLIKDINDIFCK